MLTSGSLLLEEIDGEPLIFLPHLRKAEEGIAAKIRMLAAAAAAIRASISIRRSHGVSSGPKGHSPRANGKR
jgi:hypothetical protein